MTFTYRKDKRKEGQKRPKISSCALGMNRSKLNLVKNHKYALCRSDETHKCDRLKKISKFPVTDKMRLYVSPVSYQVINCSKFTVIRFTVLQVYVFCFFCPHPILSAKK